VFQPSEEAFKSRVGGFFAIARRRGGPPTPGPSPIGAALNEEAPPATDADLPPQNPGGGEPAPPGNPPDPITRPSPKRRGRPQGPKGTVTGGGGNHTGTGGLIGRAEGGNWGEGRRIKRGLLGGGKGAFCSGRNKVPFVCRGTPFCLREPGWLPRGGTEGGGGGGGGDPRPFFTRGTGGATKWNNSRRGAHCVQEESEEGTLANTRTLASFKGKVGILLRVIAPYRK